MRESYNPDRRTVLKTVAGSLPTLYYVDEVSGGDSVEIIIAKNAEGEVLQTKKVPQEWYEHSRKSLEILRQERDELMSKEGVVRTSLSRSTEYYGGMYGSEILVGASDSGVEGSVPQEIENIPINVETTRQIGHPTRPEITPEYNFKTFDIYGGGVANQFDESPPGTSTTSVQGTNGTYLLTAAHLWDSFGRDCPSVDGETYYQITKEVGEVVETFPERDVAICDNSKDDRTFNSIICLENYDGDGYTDPNSITIQGYYTLNGLMYLKDSAEEINHMGQSSGETTGEITEVEVEGSEVPDSCITFKGHGVKLTDTSVEPGDSGGPWYGIEEVSGGDLAYMVSMTSVRNDGVFGPAMYDIASLGYDPGFGQEPP